MPSESDEQKFPLSFYLTIPHLQITFTSEEYQALEQDDKTTTSDTEKEYWLRLPNYLIARCPLCGADYHERLDTHSLDRPSQNPTAKPTYINASKYQSIGCSHFVAVTSFINLNSLLPTEQKLFTCYMGDVPTLTPTLLPDDIPSIAVMHSLPVCRIEGNAFVPRYLLYMITYYASDPATLWQRRRAEMQAIADARTAAGEDVAMHITRVATSYLCKRQPESCDLAHWVARGKLQWLDLHSRALPLRQGPVEDFPYKNIQGFSQPYTYTRQGTWPWDKWRYKDGRIQPRIFAYDV